MQTPVTALLQRSDWARILNALSRFLSLAGALSLVCALSHAHARAHARALFLRYLDTNKGRDVGKFVVKVCLPFTHPFQTVSGPYFCWPLPFHASEPLPSLLPISCFLIPTLSRILSYRRMPQRQRSLARSKTSETLRTWLRNGYPRRKSSRASSSAGPALQRRSGWRNAREVAPASRTFTRLCTKCVLHNK